MFMETYEARQNLSDAGKIGAVYDRLKTMVRENQLKPRRRLMADDLADHFRVSRTPVREALQRLGSELLITSTPSRGHFTKPFDIGEQVKLYEFAGVLFAHSIKKNGAEFSRRARFEFADTDTGRDDGKNMSARRSASNIENFYMNIVGLSGNEEMSRNIQNFVDRTHTMRLLDLRDASAGSAILSEFRTISEKLAVGDTEGGLLILNDLVGKKILRLPALVSIANDEAARAAFP
jgi:DNA-binding GntR family transcriptional regulator